MTPEQREKAWLALGRLWGMGLGLLWGEKPRQESDVLEVEIEMKEQVQAIREALGCDD